MAALIGSSRCIGMAFLLRLRQFGGAQRLRCHGGFLDWRFKPRGPLLRGPFLLPPLVPIRGLTSSTGPRVNLGPVPCAVAGCPAVAATLAFITFNQNVGHGFASSPEYRIGVLTLYKCSDSLLFGNYHVNILPGVRQAFSLLRNLNFVQLA